MAARRKRKDINLLPKEKWEKGLVGKLLKWILNIGRYVVVFTELIVIGAFLYRFSLDRKITDLKEEMDQKKAVIVSYGDFEDNFRRLQLKINTIKSTNESKISSEEILSIISQMTPMDTIYDSINISLEEISLKGKTLSEIGLATLLAKAQKIDLFSEVALDSVSSSTEKSQEINFLMTLKLKEK